MPRFPRQGKAIPRSFPVFNAEAEADATALAADADLFEADLARLSTQNNIQNYQSDAANTATWKKSTLGIVKIAEIMNTAKLLPRLSPMLTSARPLPTPNRWHTITVHHFGPLTSILWR